MPPRAIAVALVQLCLVVLTCPHLSCSVGIHLCSRTLRCFVLETWATNQTAVMGVQTLLTMNTPTTSRKFHGASGSMVSCSLSPRRILSLLGSLCCLPRSPTELLLLRKKHLRKHFQVTTPTTQCKNCRFLRVLISVQLAQSTSATGRKVSQVGLALFVATCSTNIKNGDTNLSKGKPVYANR